MLGAAECGEGGEVVGRGGAGGRTGVGQEAWPCTKLNVASNRSIEESMHVLNIHLH